MDEELGIDQSMDSALNDAFGEDTSNDTTQPSETESTTTQDVGDTDEDLQNLFKEEKETPTDTQPAGQVAGVDTTQQKQQPNNAGPQDLVDGSGKVIAKAGAERRFYEENQRLKREAQQFHSQVLPVIKKEYNDMKQKLSEYSGVINGLRATDLSSQDIQSGLDFARSWKKNPQNVVKFLLTSLQSNGIDIDIEGMQPSVQASAMKRMIDEKFAPFVQEREQAIQQREMSAKVDRTYNNFIRKYPDAVTHDKVLAYMVSKDRSLSPELAYERLKNYYLQNGLDFKIPLEVHKKNKQQPSQVGLPRNPNVSATIATNTNKQRSAKVTDSYRNIIQDVMKNAGI